MLGRTAIRSADKTLPPGALITFLQKGLQYVGMEEKLRLEASGSSKPTHPGYSLLAPPTVAALKRKYPPIQLNVPPATAAAAVKAKLQEEKRLRAKGSTNIMPSQMAVPLSPSPRGQVMDTSNEYFARQAMVAQAVAAHAAAGRSQVQPPATTTAIQDTYQQQQLVELAAIQQQTLLAQATGQPALEGLAASAAAVAATQGAKRVASSNKRSSKKRKKDQESGKSTSNEKEQTPEPATAGTNTTTVPEQEKEATPMEVDQTESQAPPPPAAPPEEVPPKVTENIPAPTNGSASGHNGDSPQSPSPSKDALENTPMTNGLQRSPNKKPDNKSLASANDIPDDTQTDVREEEILKLDMHQSEVFMCAWNPVNTHLIATGSGDASARIWQMQGLRADEGMATVKLLPHGTDAQDRKNKDVTTLEWSTDGKFLATGSYDGVARVWAQNGVLVHTLQGHSGPIFSLKWNTKGNFLLSGSYDKTTIVWNVTGGTGTIEQQFKDHEAPALDVDWKDDEIFASCSTDKTVHICKVGSPKPLKVLVGHEDEVNAVKWSPCRKMLASCSDDCTAKVWDIDSDRSTPLFDLSAHKQEIYTVKWSPTGPGSVNESRKGLLATASFDGTVRLWNLTDGSCFRTFDRHRDSVYSVAFSPSGNYLASGSLAGQLYVWNISNGKHIKSYKGQGDIFEVAWNSEETRVAACFSSNVVAVIDFEDSAENTSSAG